MLLNLYSWSCIKPLSYYLLKQSGFEVSKFVSLNAFSERNRNQSTETTQSKIDYHYSSPIYYDENYDCYPNNLKLHLVKTSAVTQIDNAEIAGNSNIIQADNGHAIYDIKYNDTEKNYIYKDGRIILYNDTFCLLSSTDNILRVESGIKLTAHYSWNYFHYVYEVLTKFYYLSQANLKSNTPLIVDSIIAEIPQFEELFGFCNQSKHEIIKLDKTQRCIVEQLILLPEALIAPQKYTNITKISAKDCIYDLNTLSFLRKSLMRMKSEKRFPRRVFLSRSKASKRRKYNENDVFQCLSSYGFAKVSPETLTVAEQIALFNGAEYIVGTTGAAFSNLLFCNSKCKALCLTNYKLFFSAFSTIAAFVGVDFVYLHDQSLTLDQRSNLHDSFQVDTKELTTFLEEVWKI